MPKIKQTKFHKQVLDNKIRIIGEQVSDCNSVVVGIYIFCGSRDEPDVLTGIAHFTEHMLFKGTKTLSALDISKKIESVGGIINAYTNKENTCYYVKISKDKLELSVQILSDIFLNSVFPEDELEKEKQVVLQEISMVNDTPDDLVHDLLLESIYGKQALGASILGSEENVLAFNQDNLKNFINNFYTNDRIVISAVGNFDWDEFLKLSKKYFSERTDSSIKFPQRSSLNTGENISLFKSHLFQTHTCIGFKTNSVYAGDKYSLKLLNYLLGGGMSSMLFQELREKTGYAYSVFCFSQHYQDTGYFEIYYGTKPINNQKCLDKVEMVLNKISKGDFDKNDFEQIKEQIKGLTLLAQDSTDARFSYNAYCELYFNDFIPIEDEIKNIFNVKIDDVVRTVNDYLKFENAKFATIFPDENSKATY